MTTTFEVTVNGRRYTRESKRPYLFVVLGLPDLERARRIAANPSNITLNFWREDYQHERLIGRFLETKTTLEQYLEEKRKLDMAGVEKAVSLNRFRWHPLQWSMSRKSADAKQRAREVYYAKKVVVAVGEVVSLEGDN